MNSSPQTHGSASAAQPWALHAKGFGDLENLTPFSYRSHMPHSLQAVYLHVIFSTKDRRPFLRDLALRGSLHAYLGSIGKQLDCTPICIGGVADHVHLLTSLSRTKTQAELIKELKRNSTTWLKEQKFGLPDFQWQTGYATFSVSQSNVDEVKTYIANQEQHLQTKTFQEELLTFLKRHQLAYDERYLWD
jgi:putative transposase